MTTYEREGWYIAGCPIYEDNSNGLRDEVDHDEILDQSLNNDWCE